MKVSCSMIGLFLFALVGGAGCETTKATPKQTLSGGVDPAVQGEGLTAAVVWEVASGSSDYARRRQLRWVRSHRMRPVANRGRQYGERLQLDLMDLTDGQSTRRSESGAIAA